MANTTGSKKSASPKSSRSLVQLLVHQLLAHQPLKICRHHPLRKLWAILLVASLSTGCITGLDVAPAATSISPTEEPPPIQNVAPGLTHRQVRNANYHTLLVESGKLTLQEGRYVNEGINSKNKTTIQIDPLIALGNFDKDIFNDAAAVLVGSGSGSTVLYELHLLRYRDGQVDHVASYLLGSDIKIQDLKIQPGLIVVTTLSKSPLSTAKSPLEIQAVRTFRLEKNRLVEVTT